MGFSFSGAAGFSGGTVANETTFNSNISVLNADAAKKALFVKGYISQTANPFEVQSYAASVLAYVDQAGGFSNSYDADLASGRTGRLRVNGTGTGLNGSTPVAKASAISAPTAPSAAYVQAEAQSMKTAVDAIRTALANIGITA